MDTVEIVLSFEEAFGVMIPGEVAEKWYTPRDAIDWIHAQQTTGSSIACLQMRSFHRLRQALEEGGWIDHRQLKLNTNLKEALDGHELRFIWKHLGHKHGLYLPDLARPSWLRWTLLLSSFFASCWIAFFLSNNPISIFLR